jgi:tRNA A37 threonylcarbamoyladenosine dehydratase
MKVFSAAIVVAGFVTSGSAALARCDVTQLSSCLTDADAFCKDEANKELIPAKIAVEYAKCKATAANTCRSMYCGLPGQKNKSIDK